MVDEEHIDKTPGLFTKCRECGHTKTLHILGDAKGGFLVGYCNFIIKNVGFCQCKEYLPQDNLDYIELLAKRKGIIPEDETDKC
jgi:hypothetical protein